MKKANIWKYTTIGLMAVMALGSIPQLSAHLPASTNHIHQHLFEMLSTVVGNTDELKSKVNHPDFGLEEIKSEVKNIATNEYIPFKSTGEVANDSTCDIADDGEGFNMIEIDSSAANGTFMITSIIITVFGTEEQDDRVRASILNIDDSSSIHEQSTVDLTGMFGEAQPSFELMGAPLNGGGNFAHQIVAVSGGDNPDIVLSIVCEESGPDGEITFDKTRTIVSGWKQINDEITVRIT